MKVKKLNPKDTSVYRELACRNGTIFNSMEWTDIFDGGIDLIGIYNKNDELIGGFNLFKESRFGLSIYCNPPFTPAIGPFLKIEATNPVTVLDTWKKALSLIADFIDRLPYAVITYSFNKNVIDMQPFIWKKFKATPRYTYLINLSRAIEDIWKRMSSERRKNVNKGEKDGLLVKKISDFEIIRTLVLQTFSRQKAKISEYYLKKILLQFSNSCNSFAFATYKNNTPIACSFFVHDQDTAYYLLGGYDHENSHHGAGALSMWQAIQYAKTLGLNCFDFEGSMIPEIEKYFRGFGGQLTPYYRINKANLPIEILLKFFKREIF